MTDFFLLLDVDVCDWHNYLLLERSIPAIERLRVRTPSQKIHIWRGKGNIATRYLGSQIAK
jgi:hypothetical protein